MDHPGMRILAISVVFVAGLLAGCASTLIAVREGSDRVTLAGASEVAGCQSKGDITVSVLANVGFINRPEADVEANLLQLAKNGAVDNVADTLVKGAWLGPGRRTYAMYKCRA